MEEQNSNTDIAQRIDRWLNIACLYKTRAKATRACEERRVKINGQVAKPAKMIKPGDEITIKSAKGKFITLKVLGISLRNVSHKDARTLYEHEPLELSQEAQELISLYNQSVKIDKKYKGRPTKKIRRQLMKFKKGGKE